MPDPVNTVPPVVTGTPVVGNFLSCSDGTWTNSPFGFAKQWQLETGVGTGVYANITGAISPTYRLLQAQIGLRVRCVVTAGNLLTWQPPTLTAPITINITNGTANQVLASGQDYIINLPGTPLTVAGGLVLNGGRNIRIIGGEISNSTVISSPTPYANAYGMYLIRQTGTVHIEGVYIHGAGIGQALVFDQSQGATVQVENCRFETLHPVGYVHTDGIQSWSGPRKLLVDRLTIQTRGVGLQVQPRQYGNVSLDQWEFHRLNVVQQTPDAYALWKNSGYGNGVWWPVYQTEVWVRNLGYLAWADVDNYPVGWRRWNPGFDAPITGEAWTLGLRPAGDFVLSTDCGIGYVSPGYL